VYEGAFRILSALGDGRSLSVDAMAREAGEGTSVVIDVLRRYPKWFDQTEDGVRASVVGLAALARELVARGATRTSRPDWQGEYEAIAAERPPAKRELDQVYVTTDTAVRRAELLVQSGDHQRGLVFLGDDDLTSAGTQLAGAGRKLTVVDTDEDVLTVLGNAAGRHGWELDLVHHDLREPLPKSMKRRFGAVFTDPPYAVEGFALFVSRAVELMKPDGRLYVSFGFSRRASERGLQKQRVLADAGLLVEAVYEDFNAYDGAEAIGARSSLWRCAMTPEARPLVTGAVDGPLYTSRPNES
jgi:predicted methyltransferase